MTQSTSDNLLVTLRKEMALRGWARPSSLVPADAGQDSLLAALGSLRVDCEIGRGPHAGQWRLSDAARRAVLHQWAPDELAGISRENGDIVARSIARALGAVPVDFQRASSEELTYLRAAVSWLPQLDRVAPDLGEQIERALGRAVIREDVRHLTRHRIVGRVGNLRTMQAVVDRTTPGRPAMLSVSGSGGTGKSTLLAMFLDKLSSKRPDIAALRFDFDRADLNPNQTTTLDRALMQQIGEALPHLRAQCDDVCTNLRAETAMDMRSIAAEQAIAGDDRSVGEAYDDAKSTYFQESAKSSHSSALGYFMNLAGQEYKRMVLVFDTFERVEAAGPRAIASTLDWAAQVSRFFDGAFTLISAGRTELGARPSQFSRLERIELGDLGAADARRLLAARGCSHELAVALARRLPRRSPLVLHLAAEAIAHGSPKEQVQLLRDIEQGNVSPELISGYLYKRVFHHIDDPLLRQYVIASLALPELHPALLHRVIVPLIEPEQADNYSRAADIFERLGAVRWLMQPLEGDRIRLRPDLRTLVVELMRGDPASRRIHARVRNGAIRFHQSAHFSDWDEAMALYHKILRAQERDVGRSELARFGDEVTRHARYLVPYVDDLPPFARVMLSERAGNEVNLEAASEVLSDLQWQRLMDGPDGHNGHGRELVTRQDPLAAHRLYRARPTTRDGLPPAYALQAACDTARWDEFDVDFDIACERLYERIEKAKRWGPHLTHLAALLRFSLLARPNKHIGGLQSLTRHLMGRCSPYGAAVGIADMVAVAEVFHRQEYLLPDFLEKLRPGEQRNRVAFLRGPYFPDPGAGLTASSMFSYNRDPAVPPDGLTPHGWMTVGDVRELHGQRWSVFQRKYRAARKLVLPRQNRTPALVMTLPELYRPLRQAMSETFARDEHRLEAIARELRHLFAVMPYEFQEGQFARYAAIDPQTWFYALCEHADRSEALPQLVALCDSIAPRTAKRWSKVAHAHKLWNAELLASRRY